MNDLEARKAIRRSAWRQVTLAGVIAVISAPTVWANPSRTGRQWGIVAVILASVSFALGCWRLFRYRRP